MFPKKKDITKGDFHKLRNNPVFIDFLIDCVFVDVSTETVAQHKGVNIKTVQRHRDTGKVNALRRRGNKRTYYYKLQELIMDSWNKKKKNI
jgi:hypothetical protein